MIKKWGEKFESKQETLPNFTQVYKALVKRGVNFPNAPIMAAQNKQGVQGASSAKPEAKSESQAPASDKAAANSKSDSKGGLKNAEVPQKFKKLVTDMNLVKGNINFTNEMID